MICPLCQSNDSIKIYSVVDDRHSFISSYSVIQCLKCRHAFTDSGIIDGDYAALYSDNYSAPEFDSPTTQYSKMRDFLFGSTFFKWWLKFDGDQYFLNKAKNEFGLRLLDYGCFEGRQLKLFEECGYDAEGLEINPIAAEIAGLKGLKVTVSDLQDFSRTHIDQFDVVILSQVIEHLPDPRGVLIQLREILINGGFIRISCPNYDSFYRLIFRDRWSNWHVPFHLHHFNANGLMALLQEANYEITYSGSITPSHGLALSILNLFGLKGSKNHKNPFLIIPAMLFCIIPLKFISLLLNYFGYGDGLVIEARKLNTK